MDFAQYLPFITPAVFVAVVFWAMKDRDKFKKELAEIKYNYLDRFADLKETITTKIDEKHGEHLDAINKLRDVVSELKEDVARIDR